MFKKYRSPVSPFSSIPFYFLIVITILSGCASSSYLKGISPTGEKVYFDKTPIEDTDAFQTYLQTPQSEVDKQHYLFQRLKSATDLEYLHDGAWYNPLQAYRGGMWLMRNRYKKGQNTRDFIRKYVERSDAGKIHVVKYPDGSLHEGGCILYNELDRLEETAAKRTV